MKNLPSLQMKKYWYYSLLCLEHLECQHLTYTHILSLIPVMYEDVTLTCSAAQHADLNFIYSQIVLSYISCMCIVHIRYCTYIVYIRYCTPDFLFVHVWSWSSNNSIMAELIVDNFCSYQPITLFIPGCVLTSCAFLFLTRPDTPWRSMAVSLVGRATLQIWGNINRRYSAGNICQFKFEEVDLNVLFIDWRVCAYLSQLIPLARFVIVLPRIVLLF